MTDSESDLAIRKKLLVARSTLCRLKIRHELNEIREGLWSPRAAAAAVRTTAGRGTLFLLALQALGEARVARLLALAGRAVLLARVARVAMAFLRPRPEGTGAPPPPAT